MEIYTQSRTTYGVMRVTETGWDSEAVQSWMVKYTGKYRNNLVWAGDYKMDFRYLNVYNHNFYLGREPSALEDVYIKHFR